jgi:hypothetical protein
VPALDTLALETAGCYSAAINPHIHVRKLARQESGMKKTLLLLAVVLALAGCQGSSNNMDRYVRNHEPKTGGPDL